MKKVPLSIRPKEAVQTILKALPNKRLRDVIERRFGIRGSAVTLDAIGKTYGITRERVRQIENDALKHLKKTDSAQYLSGIFRDITGYAINYGGVVSRDEFLRSIADEGDVAHAELLIALHPEIKHAPESEEYHPRIYIEKEKLGNSEKVMGNVTTHLRENKSVLSRDALVGLVSDSYAGVYGSRPSNDVVDEHINFCKHIGKNPYNEYGLLEWATIQPRSIRDKAYVILLKSKKPMHFQQVALAIDQSGFRGKKRAHPQTVHNELIKDSTRFVLVGRGLYALREWGYEPGTVRDVIEGVLRRENTAMSKEMIVRAVMEKRFVKENTIMLNLQNKQYFKKNDSGAYYLA